VLIFGIGAMGSLVTRMLLERGTPIVAAVGRGEHRVGRDLGVVAGLDREVGVLVEEDLGEAARRTKPDLAVVTVSSMLGVMAPYFETLLRNGVNVLTLEEQSVYPWRIEPQLSAHLDQIARQHDATLVSAGAQDVFWINLVATLAGAAQRIDSIDGYACWNAGDYGPVVARTVRIGDAPSEFEEFAATEWTDFIVRYTVEALVERLGFTFQALTESTRPLLAEQPMRCRGLEREIPAGAVRGLAHRATAATADGPSVSLEMAGMLFNQDEAETNRWTIRGEPRELKLENPGLEYDTVTGGCLVNRIPDVVEAPPGLLSLDRLPPIRYRHLARP
jgi:4-hydroxy-tetrahydrodipicolinate reductase